QLLPDSAAVLAYYGDNFDMFLNDATAVGMPLIHNVINVGNDIDYKKMCTIAKACLERGLYPALEEKQHIFNTGHGGFETTLADIAAITATMPELPLTGRAAPRKDEDKDIETWTFDNKDTVRIGPEQIMKISVKSLGRPASGFVWAGVRDPGGDWDKDKRYLIPLRPAANGGYEAELPKEVNVFTFFWTGGEDAQRGWAPGHWEGQDFEVRRQTPAENRDAINRISIDFLRNIASEEELANNLIAAIDSFIDSPKRLVIAVNTNLQGFKHQKLKMIIDRLRQWKTNEENDHPARAALLANFSVIGYSDTADLKAQLADPKKVGTPFTESDFNDPEKNIIFTFAPGAAAKVPDSIGSAERAVLVNENGLFSDEDYYPLLEVITISLSKQLMGCDAGRIKEVLKRFDVPLGDLNIADIIDNGRAFLIFTVLPKAGRIDPSLESRRYTRLLAFIRSA
ncbi:MAG: hypothetical protein PHS37_06335, partial [Candidatus Omnitrophica bacterium]|nr:hypothetical protein [Candidatus Omnitrophota bacterium]